MKRQEEIQKLIDEEMDIDNYGSFDYQIGVCDGVRLADKTMIEKAWDWFYNMALDYMSGDITDVKWGSMKEDFFKAMEE